MKKKIIISIIALLIIFIAVGTSYAFFNYNNDSETSVAKSSCFKLSFNDNGPLSIMSAIPLSDKEGSNLEPYTFTVKNICKVNANYSVNIEILNDSTLEESEVRYKLNYEDSQILGSKYEADYVVNDDVKVSKKIFSGSLNKNESKTFNLRMWLDSNTTPEKAAEKTFYTKVAVVSTFGIKEYNINFDGGELFSEYFGLESNEDGGMNYVYDNGVITMTAKKDDAYHGFKINATLVQGKKYHFEIESDANFSHSNGTDTIEVFLRSIKLADRYYQYIRDKSDTFVSSIDDDIELRLDVNKNGMTHTFSNWSLKEVIEGKRVKKGYKIGELPTPARRSGYEFIGWYTEDGKYVNSYTEFDYDQDITLHAKWEPAGKLTIDPNGGTYKGKSETQTLYRALGEYYTLEMPTREGYTFKGWNRLSSNKSALITGINKPYYVSTSATSTYYNDDYKYVNIFNNKPSTSGYWINASFPYYEAVVGHTYEISLFARVNELTNARFYARHAAYNNDFNSKGSVIQTLSNPMPWTKITLTRKFTTDPVVYGTAGDTKPLNPRFEMYSSDLKNVDYVFNVDVRDVVIKDLDTGEYIYKDNLIVEFNEEETIVQAQWEEA